VGSHTPFPQETSLVPLMQSPAQLSQSSPTSQIPSSLQVVGSQDPFTHVQPSGQLIGSNTQPLAGLQLSIVQRLLSAQLIGSLTQPPAGSQLSTVQAFESLQLIARFQHVPLLQMSVVQAFESSQSPLEVQPSGSHAPSAHVSPAGQLIGSNTQPLAGLQLSIVQRLLSLQLIGSLTHPPAGSQLSLVQALASSQSIGVFEHVPLLHTSVVQASKSSQSLLKMQPVGRHSPVKI
jgi:hypothetical protein